MKTRYEEFLQDNLEFHLLKFVDWCQHQHRDLLPENFDYKDSNLENLSNNKVVLNSYINLDKSQQEELSNYVPTYPHIVSLDTTASVNDNLTNYEHISEKSLLSDLKKALDSDPPVIFISQDNIDNPPPYIKASGGTDIGKSVSDALNNVLTIREKQFIETRESAKLKNSSTDILRNK